MRPFRPSLLLCALLLGCDVQVAGAQDATVAPRPRTPAGVMSFRGADWLERPQRAAEEMPSEVLDVMDLGLGDAVADIGAGSGYFTRRMAPMVTPGGTVYAVDVQPEMLEILMERVRADGLEGIVPVLGAPDDPKLPEASIDWMLMVDVYHELADPAAMLARMRDALTPSGRVALLEYRVEDGTGEHIRAEHRMSVRQAVAEWEAAGYHLTELHEFLPSQHLFVFGAHDAASPEPRLAHHDLGDAHREGLVEVTVTGTGDEAVALSIRRTRPGAMILTLPAGAYFGATVQGGDMIARRDGFVLLAEGASATARIPTRRVREAAAVPDSGEPLELRREVREGDRLQDLMWLLQGVDLHPTVAPAVEQIAVWIVTRDLGWDALSAHARASSVHGANAVALATTYVHEAGIDVRQRRVWTDRQSFVPEITDEGVRRAFAALGAR